MAHEMRDNDTSNVHVYLLKTDFINMTEHSLYNGLIKSTLSAFASNVWRVCRKHPRKMATYAATSKLVGLGVTPGTRKSGQLTH